MAKCSLARSGTIHIVLAEAEEPASGIESEADITREREISHKRQRITLLKQGCIMYDRMWRGKDPTKIFGTHQLIVYGTGDRKYHVINKLYDCRLGYIYIYIYIFFEQ